MELRLQTFIDAIGITSDVDNLSKDTPQVMRRLNAAIQRTSTFVVAIEEPDNMILPLNVIWVCFDSTSKYYKQALKRKSKDADPSGDFTHTWEVLYFYQDIWEEQVYDAADQASLTNIQIPTGATTSKLGLVKLSHAPADALLPVVVVEGDPRLSDARTPKPHSHAEIPATMLQHSNGVVTIANGQPAVGKVLKATGNDSATWDHLTQADIQS